MRSVSVFGYDVFEDGTIVGKRGKPLSSWDNGRGYLIVGLRVNGTRKMIGIHRLVAMAFVENHDAFPEVNHKDGNKLNNHYSNLEWCTRGRNIEHAYELKLRSAQGTGNSRCITTEDEVHIICRHLQEGQSAASIRDLGYDYNLVRAVKAKKNWRHISKHYSF